MSTHVTFKPAVTLKQSTRAVLCFVLACTLACWVPAYAFADVQRSDVVYGQSVESRGLEASQCPSIDATRAILVDSDGTVYFERNADEACQIASITKVMTALVTLDALEAGTVTLEDVVSVSSDAAAVGESTAGLAEGDQMSLQTALYALLVPSGNDAAVALSEHVGCALAGTSDVSTGVQAFVAAMNAKAQALGCTDTLYENPHGLDFDGFEGNLHSTARDQAKVIAAAMKFTLFRNIVSGGSTDIIVTRGNAATSLSLETTDGFLDIYSYAIGVKTGFTQLAGASFSAAANNGQIELYALVLNSSDETQRFYDAETLMEWAYSHLTDYSFIDSSITASYNGQSVPVVAHVAHTAWIDKAVPVTLSDTNAQARIFDLNGNVTQSYDFKEPSGNVVAGDVLGSVSFMQHNQVIATYDLIACEDVAAPNFFEGVAIWWQRLFANFTGAQTQAESNVVNTMDLVVDKSTA